MKISQRGIELIKRFEGCRLVAYKPVSAEKYYTIGIGHYGADVTQGMTITQAQADALLAQDLVKFENHVMQYDNRYHWTQNEFDALVSFAFNTGSIAQLTANGTRTISQISAKIPAYTHGANGKVLAGLVTRRTAERELFDLKEQTTSNSATQGVYTAGTTYTTQCDLYIRLTACGDKKNYCDITENGKTNSYKDGNGKAILRSGVKVTCKETKKVGAQTWMRIPSGWICAVSTIGKAYVK